MNENNKKPCEIGLKICACGWQGNPPLNWKCDFYEKEIKQTIKK